MPSASGGAGAPGKGEEAGPAVPRVLDLVLRIGELLLAGGEGAEDVERRCIRRPRTLTGCTACEPNGHLHTCCRVSYQPSLVDDPVTASRTVRRRGTDLHPALGRLPARPRHHLPGLTLEEAYRAPRGDTHATGTGTPAGPLTLAAGTSLAGAASLLVGGGPVVCSWRRRPARCMGDRLAWLGLGAGAAGVLPVRGGGDAAGRDRSGGSAP
ncbi:hypothetical protein [Streptomyces thioluteus]|uniref:hypothetical protein n=1 Tax=Streptomyces thioluteus TaxID=66431 RepID=UPI0031ECE739